MKKNRDKANRERVGQLSTNKWQLLGNGIIEYPAQDGRKNQTQNFPKRLENEFLKPEIGSKADGNKEQSKNKKSPKKGSFYLDLKPFKKAKTAREPEDVKPEVKKSKKPADKTQKKESAPKGLEEGDLGRLKVSKFPNTWEHTNFSVVPTENQGWFVNNTKDYLERDRKRIKSARTRKRNKSVELSNDKHLEDVDKEKMNINKNDTKIQVLYPALDSIMKERSEQESGGQAVVIYQRHNRRDYLHPQTGDGYRFEQIAFSGNYEATIDMVQSKRSLSEPRQNCPRDICVAKRRTRFQLEPHRMASTQSDFHTALDFLKQSNASVEFNKVEGVDSSFTRIIYQNPLNECKTGKTTTVATAVAATGKTGGKESMDTKLRLKQTAEKKLDLHREMIRAERTSKKKFWESIERSLNYRCALAEMLSSQSFMSQNNSKFFSTESSTGRSTNIYFRESVIEKISSYQGFQRIVKPNPRNKLETMRQSSSETFRKMKTILDSMLINEDVDEEDEEEESMMSSPHVKEFRIRCSSDSTFPTEMDLSKSIFLSQSASDKLNLLENSLKNNETKSDLEILMTKLSEEIQRCSRFVGSIKSSEGNGPSVKLTASDSRIEMSKTTTGSSKPFYSGWMREQTAFPVFLKHSADRVQYLLGTWPENKNQLQFDVAESRKTDLSDVVQRNVDKSSNLQRETSNTSLFSFGIGSEVSKSTMAPKSKRKIGDLICCDDCKRLKKRILKLEKELEKIEKRMPLYPPEEQESIKCGLESLKATSDTVLKRLRSCAKLRYLDSHSRKCRADTNRPVSAPNAVVQKSMQKQLSLRSSNSDYQLQVGMQLTMENVDPVTGKKLHPETSRDCQQEGNIQCRMFKDNETPVLVMDTDFVYNPKTGMLFKDKDNNQSKKQSKCLVVPLQQPVKSSSVSSLSSPPKSQRSVTAYECIPTKVPVFGEAVSPEAASVSSLQETPVNSTPVGNYSAGTSNCDFVPDNKKITPPVKKHSKPTCSNNKECILILPASPKKNNPEIVTPEKYAKNTEKQETITAEPEKKKKDAFRLEKSQKDTRLPQKSNTCPAPMENESEKSMSGLADLNMEELNKTETVAMEIQKLDKIPLESIELPKKTKPLKKSESEAKALEKVVKKAEKSSRMSCPEKVAKESEKSSKMSCPEKKNNGKTVSRIPTRRKTTPSSSHWASDPPSERTSISSLTTSTGSSVPESHSSPASSKILVKTPPRVKNITNKIYHKKKDHPCSISKGTQTFGMLGNSSHEYKVQTANVGTQTKSPTQHHCVQTMTPKQSECIQTCLTNLPWEPEAGSKPTQAYPVKPTTVNVALQVNSVQQNHSTVNVGLQTNLPTAESLKYKNDLQIQKKVNMAIAELCFHLTENKKRREV